MNFKFHAEFITPKPARGGQARQRRASKFGGGTQSQHVFEMNISFCLCEERSDDAISCLDNQIASPAKAGSQKQIDGT